MDLQLAKKGFEYARKRKKWLAVAAALSFSGYSVYKVYHLPAVTRKRKRISKLFGALVSIAEVVSDSAESIGIVSKDLKDFLQSDSDQIPKSLKQVSKIAKSAECSESVVKLTEAVTLGVLRGYRAGSRSDSEYAFSSDSSFTDQLMDKLFTKSGSGFASVVVRSFARNLVLAFYSDGKSGGASDNFTSGDHWVNVICDDRCRDLIGDCVQLFVTTAVAVYLDKTMNLNTYDDIFSGLTNPKHETKVRDMLSSVCNGAVETIIRTSQHVLANSNSNSTSKVNHSSSNSSPYLELDDFPYPASDEGLRQQALSRGSNGSYEKVDSGWVGKVSSTLAVPSNRRFVLDATGRVASESMRSFLEFSTERVFEGMRACANSVREETVDRGAELVRYATAKSSVISTISLSLCLHILESPWALVPAKLAQVHSYLASSCGQKFFSARASLVDACVYHYFAEI